MTGQINVLIARLKMLTANKGLLIEGMITALCQVHYLFSVPVQLHKQAFFLENWMISKHLKSHSD